MSAGHYHRRWSANTAGRTTPTSQTLASTIEPSTYGTSWNSVRWNKPSTAGYRNHSSAISGRFEPKPHYSVSPSARGTVASRYAASNGPSDAARTAAQVSSLGPSVSARASRFDTSVRDGGNRYRSEARELLNKWTSRERNGADNSSTSKPIENSAASGYMNKSNEFPYRKTASVTPSRTTVPSISRFSAERSSVLSPSPLPQSHTPRAERPWRQRLAESSRIRASLGDDYRSRNGSTDSSIYGARARTSTSYTPSFALSYGRTKTEEPKELMSRSYSPVRPRNEIFRSLTSTTDQSSSVFTPTTKAAADGQSDSLESRDESGKSQVAHSTVSTVPKNPSIRESSQERDPERRKKRSSKERTARRNSRQRDIKHSSSSDEDVDRSLTRADAKRRRRRHRESVERAALPPLNSAANGMLKSFDSTPSKVEDGTDSALKTTVRSPPLSPIKNIPPAVSPTTPVVVENDSIRVGNGAASSKSDVCSITDKAVPGKALDLDVSTSQLASKPNDTAPSETNEDPSASKSHAPPASAELPPKSNDSDDDFFDSDESATEASSIIEDESQYSAVVHFTPKKRKVKRIAPVPGLWKVAGAEEFISKNKRLAREPCQASTTHVWKIRPRETVSKRVRMTRVPAKKVETKPIDTPNGTLPIKNGKKPLAKKDVIEPVKNGETPLLKKEVIEPVNNVEKPTVNKGVVDVAEVVEQKKKNGTSMLRKLFSGKTKEEKADEKMKNTVVETKKDLAKLEAPVVRIEKKTEPLKKVEPLIVLENKEKKVDTSTLLEKKESKSVELKGMRVISKPVVPKEESVQMSSIVKRKPCLPKDVTVILEIPRSLKFTHPQKIRERKPLATQSVSCSLFNTAKQLEEKMTWHEKMRSLASTSLSCKATSIKNAIFSKGLTRPASYHGAQVTVDQPVPDVNVSRVRLRIKRAKKALLPHPPVENASTRRSTSVDSESTSYLCPSRQLVERSPLSPSQSRASEVLDDMRNSEPAHVVRRHSREEEYDSVGQLILPDKSLLEEYVKRKRGRLEQFLSEPIPERDEPRCDSPTNSVTSELFPACAVRVFGRSPHGVPVITAPSRSVSRVSSVASVVEPTTPTVMLDTLTNYNNFNSTPQAFLRDTSSRIQIAKPIQFDAPKTPFEERIQQQAHANRKASLLAADDRAADRHTSPRRTSAPSDGMSALTTTFTAAVAANSSHGRHERYAAHIPVNKGESSGRQSTASQDSQQSGALENATKQLDHVIDQARHKHSQHRNKFKEAIDYLDQIFEDLKKECDTTNDQDGKERSSAVVGHHPTVNSQADAIRRPTVVHPNASKTSASTPKRTLRQVKPVQPPSPLEVVLPQPPVVVDSESAEVDVTETIVLPKKTDKLDFTRRWLHDDLSSLAHQPSAPTMFLPEPCSYYNDADEHSLGSCSAEVAAINSTGKKEKPKRSNGVLAVNSLEKPAPIRPQPCRPQPVYGTQERTSGWRHFPVELEVPSIPRVASFDQVPDRRDYPTNTWRSGSQEPFQTHGSVPPEDVVMRPSPSAFQSVSNFSSRGGNMRGSLRSLPDAGLIIRGRYQQQPSPMKDPSLAIDQLCAELELNTEQPLTAADKRRSFPTSYAHDSMFATGSSIYEQPVRRMSGINERKAQPYQQPKPLYHAAVSSHQPVHQSHSQPVTNQHRVAHAAAQHPAQQPVLQSTQRSPQAVQYSTHPVVKKAPPQRQQKSLDEVTNMLNNVVNDFHASQAPRKKSQPSHTLYATPHTMNQSNPFETINQEKISPSRVEAMHNMFERNAVPAPNRWNTTAQPYHATRPRDDDAYHDINEFSSSRPLKPAVPAPPVVAAPVPPPYIGPHASPPRNAIGVRNSSPHSYTADFVPAYPTTQPPSHPPGRNGSATSSQNGGYYSSNSSGVGVPVYQNNQISARRGSIVGHQSTSSRAPSIADDDDDDGFYDNIGTFDDRRFSRSSEMDVASLSSHQLPPTGWKPTKIGSFLRKIGGGNRPPGSAASLVSLNKVANESPIKPGNLMKSNSLSNEPWKKMVIDGPSIPAREPTPSKAGFGARIKNSIFGSKRRLNG